MLKILAKQFELTEKSISSRSLRRMWWMMLVSLPIIPMFFWIDAYGYPVNVKALVFFKAALIITSLAAVGFGCSRFVNRFYFPDKYLDEWEIRIKHKSMVFAVQVFACTTLIISTVALTLENWLHVPLPNMPTVSFGHGVLLVFVTFFYVQTFKALSMVVPIDDNEFEDTNVV